MKRLLLPVLLLIIISPLWAQQPFTEYGYNVKVATLSKGKYNEFFDQDTLAQIGSVVINRLTGKIVMFVSYDTVYSEATLNPELISRWISPDPYANAYYSYSPYSYANNNPIIYIDSEGGFKIPVHHGITSRVLDRLGLNSRLFRMDILSGNTWEADIFSGGQDIHFDGRKNFSEINTTWQKLNTDIQNASIGNTERGGAASMHLGKLLHSVQDFYSHSNYVELFVDYYAKKYGGTPSSTEIPTYDEAVGSPLYSEFKKEYLEQNLKTGEFNLGRYLMGNDVAKTNEEGNIHHNQMEKDKRRSMQTYGGTTLHDLAVSVATQHTMDVVSSKDTAKPKKLPVRKFKQDW